MVSRIPYDLYGMYFLLEGMVKYQQISWFLLQVTGHCFTNTAKETCRQQMCPGLQVPIITCMPISKGIKRCPLTLPQPQYCF